MWRFVAGCSEVKETEYEFDAGMFQKGCSKPCIGLYGSFIDAFPISKENYLSSLTALFSSVDCRRTTLPIYALSSFRTGP
jgi:hypothetical protein